MIREIKNTENDNKGYLSLCYHYIRPNKEIGLFSNLLGSKIDDFHEVITELKNEYEIISLDNAYRFSYGDAVFNRKNGILFTFDDCLSDHYAAAQMLADLGIKGVFFIPTCILKDNLPVSPTIVHYCLARYRVDGFLNAYRNALEEFGFNIDEYDVKFKKGKDDSWKAISEIKSIFWYKLNHNDARKIILHIYRNLLLRDYPNALEMMHLTSDQIRDIINMGHSIGAHSHSHLSVGVSDLSEDDFNNEIIDPKKYLEEKFNTSVIALSYPFGLKKDCLSAKELIIKSDEYKMAFTIEKILNTKKISPLELGRYMPTSKDNSLKLKNILELIIKGKGDSI